MKAFAKSRSVKGIVRTAIAYCAVTVAGYAQAQGSRRGAAAFVLDGMGWPDQATFIGSGGRCLTRDVIPAEAQAVQAEHHAFKQAVKAAIGGGNPDAVTEETLATVLGKNAGEIPVYFHVITDTSGAGGVEDQQIKDQLSVRDAAYRKAGFDDGLPG